MAKGKIKKKCRICIIEAYLHYFRRRIGSNMILQQEFCVPSAVQMFMLELLGQLALSSTGERSLSRGTSEEGPTEKNTHII